MCIHIYVILKGLIMDSPLAGLLADIYIHNVGVSQINNKINPLLPKIKYWFRYVDDILCLFEGSKEESNDFFILPKLTI